MCKTFKFISGKWKVWCKIKGGAALILNSHYQKQIEDNEQMWHESNSRAVCATHTHPLLSERLLETHLFHIDSAGTQRHRSPPLISRRNWDIINPLCINEQLRSIHSSFPCSSLSFVPHFFHHNSLLWCPRPHLFFSLSDFILGAITYYISKRLSLHSLHLTSVNKYCPAVPLPSFMSDLL